MKAFCRGSPVPGLTGINVMPPNAVVTRRQPDRRRLCATAFISLEISGLSGGRFWGRLWGTAPTGRQARRCGISCSRNAAQPVSSVLFRQVLQYNIVRHGIRRQAPESGVPVSDGAQLRRIWHPCFLLFGHPDNQGFYETALSQLFAPSEG